MKRCQDDNRDVGESVARVQELFVKYSPRIRAYLLALLPDVHAVDDLMHCVFLAVTNKAAEFDPQRDFIRWAYGFARIELARFARQSSRSPMALSPEVIDKLSESVPTTETTSERIKALMKCIAELAPRARQAIELRYLSGLRPSEIAERMSIGVNSIHVMLSRARTALQACVERKLRIGEDR